MHRFTIILVFLFVLFIQFNQQQAASIHLSSSEELQDLPLHAPSSLLNSWYNRLNDIQETEEQQQQRYSDHLWKRVAADLPSYRQRRRFGNTRYGRSLPDAWK
jgi:transposase